jgi:hypothetical protein
VYKFSTPESVASGHRTCTLYSQFNLPSAVTIDYNLQSTLNENINGAEITALGNNPQAGGGVPQAFKDATLSTQPDNQAFSGLVQFEFNCVKYVLTMTAGLFGSWPMDRRSAKL